VASATISVSITIKAPAEAIFAVLADPANHAAIDGTGWVCDPLDRQPLTASGQIFRMAMYHANHPNGNYEMANLDLALRPGSTRPVRDRRQAHLRLVGCTRGGPPTGPVPTFLARSPRQFADPPRRTGRCLSASPPWSGGLQRSGYRARRVP